MPGTRKLGKPTDQRMAMLRQQVTDFLDNGKMETTLARAKEIKPLAEKMITLGKKNTLASRRQAILDRLRTADRPVSASALAAGLNVSRQIIVGDIALLRAGGAEISATPRGYVLPRATDGITRTIACRHTLAQTGQELDILVDNGCTVLDVIVEHPVYGQLTGQLQISSRYDVEQFLARIRDSDAAPLSMLTGGLHLHTLCCPNEDAYTRACAALKAAGLLLDD